MKRVFEKPVEVISRSAEQTHCLGRCLGISLQRGTVIRLAGDLGAGKTCFVQGLARGLEVPPEYDITSPTYTLIHEYAGRLPLVHIDLYRLGASGDAEAIGLWEYMDADTVTAVEWPDRLDEDQWPMESLCMTFETLADGNRRILLNGYGLAIHNLILQVVALYPANCFNELK